MSRKFKSVPGNRLLVLSFLLVGKLMHNLPKELRKVSISEAELDEAIKYQKNPIRFRKKMDPKTFAQFWEATLVGLDIKSSAVTKQIKLEIQEQKRMFYFD